MTRRCGTGTGRKKNPTCLILFFPSSFFVFFFTVSSSRSYSAFVTGARQTKLERDEELKRRTHRPGHVASAQSAPLLTEKQQIMTKYDDKSQSLPRFCSCFKPVCEADFTHSGCLSETNALFIQRRESD